MIDGGNVEISITQCKLALNQCLLKLDLNRRSAAQHWQVTPRYELFHADNRK